MNENIFFWRVFGKRTVICFFLMCTLFLGCILRIAVICSKDYTFVSQNQNYYRLKIANIRGTIYDRNMIPLTNNIKKTVAAISPTPRATTALSTILKSEEFKNALNELKKGKPIICEVPKRISCDGIICTEIYTTNTGKINHTIGFCNNDGIGVMGLEKAYEEILNSKKSAELIYECDGKGRILEGLAPTLEYDSAVIANGIITTIDSNLQNIAEYYADYIEKGAIVIADAKNGKIYASVSRPYINLNSSNEDNSPYIDRTINAYSVGSVFKPCVSVAGIENNINNFLYTCSGSCEIADRVFKCHNENGHGLTDLKRGIANSCNTFFFNYANKIGGSEILKIANNLRFGTSISLCKNIKTANGSLPSEESLYNQGLLANFCIGQGELTVSPVSILTLYMSIANEGLYCIPSLVEGKIVDGEIIKEKENKPTRVMSKATANEIKGYLEEVILNGTGINAKPKYTSAAGKTATAQTGKFDEETEICSGWFCGFFPLENPSYVVVIFSEDTRKQSKTCSEIFAQIADEIYSKFDNEK